MRKKNIIKIISIFIFMSSLSGICFLLFNTKSFNSNLSKYENIFDVFLHEKAILFHNEYFTSNELFEKMELKDAYGIQSFFNEKYMKNPCLRKIEIIGKIPPFEGPFLIATELDNLFIYFKIYNSDYSLLPDQYIKFDIDEKKIMTRLMHDDKMVFSNYGKGYDFVYGMKVEPIGSMLHFYDIIISIFIGLLFSYHSYRFFDQVDSFFYKTTGLNKIIFLFEKTEEFSANHSRNVAEIAHFLGKKYGLRGKKLKDIKVAAYLHDIGKISIPVEILNKPETLNKDEFGVIKKHVIFSAEIIENFEELKHLREIILYHHEKMDGSGYPEGLDGEAIPLGSRIIAVADIYEALVGKRPYRDSFSMDKALFTMRNMPLDRKVFDLLIEFRYEVNALITNSKDEKEPKKSVI